MRILAGLVLVLLLSRAWAQEDALQRELILRDRQADAFALQLKHYQEVLRAPSAAAARELEVWAVVPVVIKALLFS